MPKTASRTRSTAREACELKNVSTSTPIFRRYPRLGSSYQTKVPPSVDGSYQPSRQVPVLLSKEFPDILQSDLEDDNKRYAASDDSPGVSNTGSSPGGGGQGAEATKKPVMEDSSALVVDQTGKSYGYSKRGGIRVSYGSGTANADALLVSRAFLLGPTDRDDEYGLNPRTIEDQQELDQAWLGKLVEWYQLTLDAKQPSCSRRSRFKRPREAPAVPEFGDMVDPQPTKRLHLETDETMLSNPCALDDKEAVESVPIEQKRWSLSVALSGGRTVRGLRKRRREGELDSWSKVPSSTLPMQGDFRSEPIDKPVPLLSASSRSVSSTWRAVLAAAEAFEKNLTDVRLNTLLCFFDHIRRLPPPSQVLDETTRIAQTVNECLGRLWKECTEARELRAKWMDLWYSDSVELDAARKALKVVTPLLPDEYHELERQLSVVTLWQTRLNETLTNAAQDDPSFKRDDLASLESLAVEAEATHGFRCKGFLTLQAKLQKAYEMRDKLRAWKNELDSCGTVKTMNNMVREIQRLKIRFPEANELLVFSRDVDLWVERADIAIRSRISLKEIEDLIRRGLDHRVDLSEYIDKLRLRVQQAQAWLEDLKNLVDLDGDKLEWMSRIRKKLADGMNTQFHDLACEGSRLPVEVDFVQLIQLELDARQWSDKTQKWLPATGEVLDSSKAGKIEEMREHLKKASALGARLPSSDRSGWELEFEHELHEVVRDADKWFEEQYGYYFEGDNRKATSRRSISISELRRIDEEGNKIPVNLGTAKANVNRYLIQAETWYKCHRKLLLDAGLERNEEASTNGSTGSVSLDLLKSAMDDANNGIAFELEEVNKVARLIEKLECWFEKVCIASGTAKRRIRGKRTTFAVKDLQSLISQASSLPVDASRSVEMLQDRITAVEEWRKRVTRDLGTVARSFQEIRESLVSKYGDPASFSRDTTYDVETPRTEGGSEPTVLSTITVDNLIRPLSQEAYSSSITTHEGEVVSNLEQLSRWISRSIKYLSCSDEVFDKRFFGAFDRFFSEGKDLQGMFPADKDSCDVTSSLNQSCSKLLIDQLCRMKVLLNDRDEFSSWCEHAEKVVVGEDKRCTIERLRELCSKSEKFPIDNDLVKQVKLTTRKADDWIAGAKRSIASVERLKLLELKAQIDEGEKLGIQSTELRELKGGLKAARSWANRVKKCKPELCVAKMSDINMLVDEYESLMVEMPEEIAKLNKAISHYCICRGQYEGQMIPCEECKDSFHAPCLGLSKARAEKTEKFMCVRCSVKKVYLTSSSTVAAVVRKWTSDKELHKARQSEAQKHHRKVRKEQKDIEKHRKVAEEVTQSIAQIDALNKCQVTSSEETFGSESVNQQKLASGQAAEICEGVQHCGFVGSMGEISLDGHRLAAGPHGSNQIDATSLVSRRVELIAKMEKTSKAIGVCETRLKSLEAAAAERRNREELENAQAGQLQRWCMLVRNVIAPGTKEEADIGRPGKDGQLPGTMQAVISEAEKLCITSYKDVCAVKNAFACICWSSRAMEVLRRQPTSGAVESLVNQGQRIKLPEDKALKTLRTMSQRADAWNLRFRRALAPDPGNSNRFDMKELHELAKSADKIPLVLPYEHRLETVIEDEGCRYCLCGGPSDGRFMVGCDKCDKWFHGACVGVNGEDGEELGRWFCPECRRVPIDPSPLVDKFHDSYGCEVEDSDDDDVASKAPDPCSMWPPFGLKDSGTAFDALGLEIPILPEINSSETPSCTLPVVSSSCSENTEVSRSIQSQELPSDDTRVKTQPHQEAGVSTTLQISEAKGNNADGSGEAKPSPAYRSDAAKKVQAPQTSLGTERTSPAEFAGRGNSLSDSAPVDPESMQGENDHGEHLSANGRHSCPASRESSLSPMVSNESSYSLLIGSDSRLRVNGDTQGEVAPVAS